MHKRVILKGYESQMTKNANNEQHQYNLKIVTIDYYKELFVMKYNSNQIIEFANELLEGSLVLGYKNLETIRYNPHKLSEFNWNIGIKRHANTFSLYLHGLRHIYLLTEAYRLTTDSYYIELAEDFILSFYNYAKSDKIHLMMNNDHSLSERIENLVYLFCIAETENYLLNSKKYIIEIIEQSLQKLLSDKYYQKNHNHGIIVDKAALIGIYFMNKKNMWEDIEFIINRLKAQVEYAYLDGVHKENSLDYHFMVTALLWGCLNILRLIGHDYKNELYIYLQNANRFIAYALKPNKFRPLFGDSKGVSSRGDTSIDVFNNDEILQYIESKGKEGRKPVELSGLFPAGYVFFREHFKQDNFEQATWLSLKAGFVTRVHKHHDDLSICLYSKGYDIFVDSGMCGYMPKDKYKDYMESIPAHTTIGIRDKAYSIASGNGEKFKIQKFIKKPHYDYAMASSRGYHDAVIYRHVYYLRNNDIIIIRDEIYSESKHEYAQYFNLSNDVSILENARQNVLLEIGQSDHKAIIRQLNPIDQLNILNGTDTVPMSMLSTGFGTCEPSTTLEYTKSGHCTEFLTVVEIFKDNHCGIQLLENAIQISLFNDQINIPIAKTNPLKFNGAEIEIIDKQTVRIKNTVQGDEKYSFYVYTKNSILKFPYTKEEYMEFEAPEDIVILYYIANETGETLKGILGELTYTEKGMVLKKKYETLHQPIIKEHHIHPLSKNKFEFIVDVEYDYQANCSWWIYYNGSHLHYEQNKNYSMTFEFSKPGEYVVMYSLRDRYFGEFAFDQFEKIEITD
ncbi:MAG: heparinase II/III domain-containing protein [Christensenellales bacterium]